MGLAKQQCQFVIKIMPTYQCQNCKNPFEAREADRARGWARFCGKSCKAKKQESKTGQFRRLINQQDGDDGEQLFSNAHLFSNEE